MTTKALGLSGSMGTVRVQGWHCEFEIYEQWHSTIVFRKHEEPSTLVL